MAMGSLSSDKDSWITVSYASPYAGSSPITFVDKDNTQTYDGTQTSYGIWMGSPDIGNLVYVFLLMEIHQEDFGLLVLMDSFQILCYQIFLLVLRINIPINVYQLLNLINLIRNKHDQP